MKPARYKRIFFSPINQKFNQSIDQSFSSVKRRNRNRFDEQKTEFSPGNGFVDSVKNPKTGKSNSSHDLRMAYNSSVKKISTGLEKESEQSVKVLEEKKTEKNENGKGITFRVGGVPGNNQLVVTSKDRKQ